MLNKIIILFLFLIHTTFSIAQNANWVWGKSAGGNALGAISGLKETATDMVIDNDGNVYFCGIVNHSNQVSFDTLVVPTFGEEDLFIAKFTSEGKLIWVKIGGTTGGGERPKDIAIDTVNKLLYLTGSFRTDSLTSFNFANDTIITGLKNDFFLVQLDLLGNFNWMQVATSDSLSRVHAISTDYSGNLNMVFSADSGQVLQTLNLSSSGQYLCRLDINGKVILHQKISNRDEFFASDMDIDNQNNTYIVGYFEDTAIVAGNFMVSEGSSDALIIKFDSLANPLWVVSEGYTNGNAKIHGIDVDGSSSFYFIGSVHGISFDWAGKKLTNSGPIQSVMGKYDSNGNMLWVTNTTGNNAQPGADVKVGNNYAYFTGVCAQKLTLDGLIIYGSTVYDPYIAVFKKNGEIVSLDQIRGSGIVASKCMAVDERDSVYLAGLYSLDINYQNINLSSVGNDGDIFIAKCGFNIDTTEINDTTGIYDWNSDDHNVLQIYPNPNNGKFIIINDQNFTAGYIQIRNEIGQIVYSNIISKSLQQEVSLDVQDGLYFVSVLTETGNYVRKINIIN